MANPSAAVLLLQRSIGATQPLLVSSRNNGIVMFRRGYNSAAATTTRACSSTASSSPPTGGSRLLRPRVVPARPPVVNTAASSTPYYSHHAASAGMIERRTFVSSTRPLLDDLPPHEVVGMPALSPTMEVGSVTKWNVSVGSSFQAGDSLATIETDKASMELEAQDDGVVARILVAENDGTEVNVGVPIMVTVEEMDDVSAFENFVVPASDDGPESNAVVDLAATAPPADASSSSTQATTRPSGRPSRMTFLGKDGWAARRTPGAAPAPTAADALVAPAPTAAAVAPTVVNAVTPEAVSPKLSYVDEPCSGMRKVIARRLTESKSTVPHYYASVEVALDEIMKLRKVLKTDFDVKVSVNDLIIKASAMALRDVPEVNGTYDSKTNTVRTYDDVDISIAVATPTGLITPIVPGTDSLGLAEISAKVKDLATRAKEGKLAPEEYQGGTFCISNLGMFGIDEFSAVINPPQAAILAVGGGTRKVVPTLYDPAKTLEDQPVPEIKTVMTARLSADRRVVDEATAGLFLACLKEYLNQPKLLLL